MKNLSTKAVSLNQSQSANCSTVYIFYHRWKNYFILSDFLWFSFPFSN